MNEIHPHNCGNGKEIFTPNEEKLNFFFSKDIFPRNSFNCFMKKSPSSIPSIMKEFSKVKNKGWNELSYCLVGPLPEFPLYTTLS